MVRDMCKDATEVDESTAYAHLGFPVYDHYLTKMWALKLATDAALTVLRVDHIIMSKPAGGPKMRKPATLSQAHSPAARKYTQ